MVPRIYTVVGFRLDTNESFVHSVEAENPAAAVKATEQELLGEDPPAWEVCAVIEGDHRDRQFEH